MSTFRQKIEQMSEEAITTSDYESNYKTWVKDSTDDFFSQVGTENSSLLSGLIVGPGHADYASIINELPADPQRQASILSPGSLYWRNDTNKRGICSVAGYKSKVDCEANSGTWSADRWFFCVNDGVIYNFVNVAQLNLAYHMIIKIASIKHLEHVQATDPNSKRAALITKHNTDKAADVSVFASDANAAYTANVLNDPIRLEDAYQKVKVTS